MWRSVGARVVDVVLGLLVESVDNELDESELLLLDSTETLVAWAKSGDVSSLSTRREQTSSTHKEHRRTQRKTSTSSSLRFLINLSVSNESF